MFYQKIKKLFMLIASCSIIIISTNSCTNYYNDDYYAYDHYYNFIEEYITRIGKRLLIVDDNHKLNIKFALNNNSVPLLTMQHNTITISNGVLNYLKNEAELVAILAIALETINNNNYQTDHRIIMHLYKAGYDPLVLVELEEEYLNSQNSPNNWLDFLFSSMNITIERINANKNIILKMPKGLFRGEERYLSSINHF